MERIHGLRQYIACEEYRKALGLPENVSEEYTLLAQGEYNINFSFVHPHSGKTLLLRVNCGSQMHLDNQIQYEYNTLKLLEKTGRTPRPVYVDGSRKLLDHGIMVMEFLPGRALNYNTDMKYAAECLADIHSVKIPLNSSLISPENPLKAILEECEEMFRVYMDSELGDAKKKKQIRRMLDAGWEKVNYSRFESGYHCCINTELNSTNFLINGEGNQNYLVDWEKPLYGVPVQDLGHFLAPTTTFWKTDVILNREEINHFMRMYIGAVDGRFPTSLIEEQLNTYISITCLRGITWCAMAWIQYQQPDKLIFNASTYNKLQAYLSEAFLDMIEQQF